MGPSDPAQDHLSSLVEDRRIESSPENGRSWVCTVRFRTPLSAPLEVEIESEAHDLEARRGRGLLVPRTVRIASDKLSAELQLDPFDARALRLDHIGQGLARAGSPFGSPVSALIAGAVASRLRHLHAEGRAHGDLALQHVLVGPGGGVALVAAGLPMLRVLMAPAEALVARLRRRAPECILGEASSPRSDVFALGALYYELLAGRPYRADTSAAAVRSAARARLTAELPGALPDPRTGLVELLRACLDPNPEARPRNSQAFLQRLKSELATAQVSLAERSTLASLLEEYVDDRSPRGPAALSQAPGSAPATAPPAATASGWAAVLGETPEPEGEAERETAPPPGAAAAVESLLPSPAQPADPTASDGGRLSVPLPEAPAATVTPVALSDSPLASPVGTPASLDDLAAPRPRQAPTLDAATKIPPRAIALGLGAMLLVGGAIYGLAYLRSPGASVADVPDAGPAFGGPPPPPTPKDAGIFGMQRPVRPDAGATLKSLGLVSIMSNPSGAEVLIDGGYVGKTPLVLKHPVRRGQAYAVELEAEGYEPWSQSVRAKSTSISLVVSLVPKE